jgi:RHS repeat-associated protein
VRTFKALRISALSAVLVGMGLWFPVSPAAAAAWTIADLGGQMSCGDYGASAGLNDTGQVVGCGTAPDGGVGALIWSPGAGAQVLGHFFDFGYSVGAGINNSGLVAGTSSSEPFLWSGQTMTNLCNTADCVSGAASGINNSGQVAGTFFDMNSGMFAFVSSGAAMQRLGTLPGGTYTAALAIGNNGVIAGYGDSIGTDGVARVSAVLWSGSTAQSLGLLPNGYGSVAYGLNNVGQVVGAAPTQDGGGAFLWSSITGMQNLGSLYQGGQSEAYAVNDFAQVVGWSDGDVVLWSNGTLIDLSALPEVQGAGWWLTKATGINNAGQIVGTGWLNGEQRTFLLSPGAFGSSSPKSAGRCPAAGQGSGEDPNRPGRCDPANSINPATGNNHQLDVDYVGASAFPLRFERYYNSVTGFGSGNIGTQWRHTYDRSVLRVNSVATVFRPDGKQYVFTQVGGVWSSDPDVMDRLVQTRTGWTYTAAPDDDVETYDVNGRLTSIANRAGIAHILGYDTNGRLSSVTHSAALTALSFSSDASGRIITMTDSAGNVFTYAYQQGNLASVTYPADPKRSSSNPVRTYLYNEQDHTSNTNLPHYLTGIIDENNDRFASYTYDTNGRGISTERAGGTQRYSLAYAGGGRASVTDPLLTSRTYLFKTLYSVPKNTSVDQPCVGCGVARQTGYDANGFLSSATNFNSVNTTYIHDGRGLETSRTEASGTLLARTISTQWHPTYRLPLKIAQPERITTLAYDAQGNLISKSVQATTDTSGAQSFNATPTGVARTWTYTNTYSNSVPGLMIRQVVDGPRTDVNDTTTYEWDRAGNLSSVTNALGHVTALSNYDAHGRPRLVTDPNGLVTMLTYDVRGRLTSRNVGGETTAYEYDGVGQLTKVTLPDGSFLCYSYDPAHRLTRITDNLGNKIVYTLDAVGNHTQEQVFDPRGKLAQTRTRVYDNLNRLSQDIGGANPTTEIINYGRDNQGNLTSVTDPLGHVTNNIYDALNRLSQVIDPAASGSGQGGTTQYSYDGVDQLSQVLSPRGVNTVFALDGLGNLNWRGSLDLGRDDNIFDPAGNLVRGSNNRRGVVTYFTYDAQNRPTQAIWAQAITGSGIVAHPNVTHTYTYDQGTYGKGKLSGVTDSSGSTSYAWDQNGRLAQETRILSGVSYTTAYGYDAFGRLNRITYPSGRTVNYSFDALGRISQVDTSAGGATQMVVGSVTYVQSLNGVPGFGGIKSFMFGNAGSYSRSYDLDGRIAAYSLGDLRRTLKYDAASRVAGFTHNNPAFDQTFGYDNMDRLTSWIGPNTSQAYAYDLDGNRTSNTVGVNTYIYIYPATSNQLSLVTGPIARTSTYDAGNLRQDGRIFMDDARGRLYRVVNVTQSTLYQVNAMGQRVLKTASNGVITVYHYDKDGNLIAESNAKGQVTREYIYLGATPVAVVDATTPAALYFIHPDHLGTPRVIVNASNTVVWRWDSADPFGSLPPNSNPSGLGTFTFNLRFPGQYFDQETNLHYNYYRDYDPANGRYVQSDPIGLKGGINTYTYVRDNPTAKSDPRGLIDWTAP